MPTKPAILDCRRFGTRMAIVFAASFGTVGVFNPFFPVWLEGEGLSPDEIGLVIAAQVALRVVVCPLVLRLADRAPDRAMVLIGTAFAAAVFVNLLFLTSGFWPILLATLLVAAFWAPIIPLSDAIALSGVRRMNIDYGKARLWGSVTFILVNVAAGLALSRFGSGSILAIISFGFALAAFVMLFAPRVGRPMRVSTMPVDAVGEPCGPPASAESSLMRRLAPKPDIRVILPALVANALVQASHAAFYAFGSILWTRLGYSGTAIGCFWAIGVVAEVILFRQASGLVARFGARAFILAGGIAAVVRWLAFGFDLGIAGFAVIQVLHGLTFGATHLALQALIVGSVAEERLGSAQGTGFALQTGAIALVTLTSGPAFAALDARMFWLMAGLAAIGTALAAVSAFPEAYPQSEAEGGETVASE